MCVLAMAWQASPRWRLVVAGNRDELHARPAAPAARWADASATIAGRDLQSGGTWMGVSERGRFAVVTNFASADRDPAAPSRGALVSDFLAGSPSIDSPDDLARYNALSLITVDHDTARFAANRPPTLRTLAPGFYGLSNGLLDEPWPRTISVIDAVRAFVADDGTPEDLLTALAEPGDDPAIARFSAADRPDPSAMPVFIRNPVYGTRCSTVVTVDDEGTGRLIERRFDAEGAVSGESDIAFAWPATR